jgi:hypothetical protein
VTAAGFGALRPLGKTDLSSDYFGGKTNAASVSAGAASSLRFAWLAAPDRCESWIHDTGEFRVQGRMPRLTTRGSVM